MSAHAADHVRVLDAWCAMARRAGLSIPRTMTPARVAPLLARIREVGVDAMLEAIAKVEASDHCRGLNDRGWRADFDFLCTASRLPRILDGRYDNRPSGSPRNGARILLERELGDDGLEIRGSVVHVALPAPIETPNQGVFDL